MAPNAIPALGFIGTVITALCAVVVFQNRDNKNLYKQLNDLQETRITDAKETRDKLTEPLEKQAAIGEKTYELLLNLYNKRGV